MNVRAWVSASFVGSSRDITVFTATNAVIQALPLLTSPIIARLYSPTAFGGYAVYCALAIIIGTVSSLAFTNVIIIEKDDNSAINGAGLCITSHFLFAIVLAVLLLAVPNDWVVDVFDEAIASFILVLPLTIFFAGTYHCLYTWFLRKARYRDLSRNKIIFGISAAGLQIGIGLMRMETLGFIIANVLAYLLGIFLLLRLFIKYDSALFFKLNLRFWPVLLRKHRAFPLFTVPSNIVNSLAGQLPSLLIAKFFGSADLGQYALGQRVVSAPLGFVSTSVQDVFRQIASKEFNEHGHCRTSFNKVFAVMFLVALVVLLPLILVLPLVIPFVFGDAWTQSGVYVQAIAFMLLVRFVSSPLSYIWIITGRQRLNLYWQTGLLIITASAFYWSFVIMSQRELSQTLFTYAGAVGIWYFICLVLTYRFSRSG